MNMYPVKLSPVYKDYLWGGDRIPRVFKREHAPGGLIAESWEVSDRSDGMGVVTNGALAGKSFADLIQLWGRNLLGARVAGDRFPLLIKLIDARERLSVQVHPNDETAAKYGGEAKTECWYILEADSGAGVYAGFKPGVDAAAYAAAVAQGATGNLLNHIPVQAGDAVFIPGGLVHAIDAGCLILEVQQNSNTTYRIDDWGRVGADGQPRALHVQQAAQVIRWDITGDPRVTPRALSDGSGNLRHRLVESPFFLLDRIDLQRPQQIDGRDESFIALFIASGTACLEWPGGHEILVSGSSCLVPAALRGALVTSSDRAVMLHVTVP
ncbi:MAG TPA: class I mannose-6-phosphate isomerase [Kiritimatiellia bacterium]|nr:class I mannose-6-phosphate isomerase [Kiritimatiellia bacterium]HMO98317.1 class I mannose-6-phosphate isomerase [Kiritimatiellia bacterium]